MRGGARRDAAERSRAGTGPFRTQALDPAATHPRTPPPPASQLGNPPKPSSVAARVSHPHRRRRRPLIECRQQAFIVQIP
ncbi:hypothetical protein PLESTB_001722100 [Pleodorina starrii]|uniref:Uncharacterized protein n=1 Tax=Pleodorina starrii TaxID=330485 RepID=A0A9W6F988_9CHLO|nr:hypothetical protein PLESTB_001722100 [Pleodorina starrii]